LLHMYVHLEFIFVWWLCGLYEDEAIF
jgi:hypothetical protein